MRLVISILLLVICLNGNAQIRNGVYKCNQKENHYSGRTYYNYTLLIDDQNIIFYGWYQDDGNCSDTTYIRSWMTRKNYKNLKVQEIEFSNKSYFSNLLNFKKVKSINQYRPIQIGYLRLIGHENGKLIYNISSGFGGGAADEVVFEKIE